MWGRWVGRRFLLLLVPALIAAVLPVVSLAACGGAARSSADDAPIATPREGGTYNYPLQEDPGVLDPLTQQVGEGDAILHQLYEGLVRYDEQPDGSLKTVPCLAESWSASADATVWTFKLRRGVMFHAPVSREVTAADVVADLRYLADPAHKSQVSYMLVGIRGVDDAGYARRGQLGVTALDRYTVRFRLTHPFSEFPDTLGSAVFWVWPADYLLRVGIKAYAEHPVGTGPYQFERRVPGKSVDLVRNPQWWDISGGPYIHTVHYEVFSSVSSMMLAFQKGSIDWTWVPKGQIEASQSLPQVTSGHWKVGSSPILALGYLFVNMKDPVVGGTQGLSLRQALAYGCDRQAAIDASSDGVHLLPTGLVPPGVPGSGGVSEPYTYDPARATELMRQRGPATLELAYTIGRFAQTIAESLTASYARMGITLEPRPLKWNDYISRLAAGKAQAFLLGWAADYPSMDNFLYTMFESDSSGATSGTFYSNPDVDALFAKARATPDREARIQLYAEAERRILADAPGVPLFVYAEYRLSTKRVANVRFNSMGWADLWRAWVK